MPLRKPPSRTARARASSNDPRRLPEPPPAQAERLALAARATVHPYAKHKRHPTAYGLTPYAGEHEDPSFCDEHAGFTPADMPRAPRLLARGIEAGLFGKTPKQGDPGLLWSVDDTGWIYEAQITVPGAAVYHAYPVLPNEAIVRRVLERYAQHVAQHATAPLTTSLAAARRLYR